MHAVFGYFFGFMFGIVVFLPTSVIFFAVAPVLLVAFVRPSSSLPMVACFVLVLYAVFFDTNKFSKIGPVCSTASACACGIDLIHGDSAVQKKEKKNKTV